MARLNDDLARLVAYRELVPGDVALVNDTWSKSFRDSPWAGVIPNNMYHEVTRQTITGLMARGARFIVACRIDDPDQVLGWLCHEDVPGGSAVHYLFVKGPYRRQGLASELLRRLGTPPDARRFYTHRTRNSGHFPGWTHAPEIARRKEHR